MGLEACFSQDGRQVLTASGDAMAKLLDAENGSCLCTFHGLRGAIYQASLSQDSTKVLAVSGDHYLGNRAGMLFNAKTGVCLRVFDYDDLRTEVISAQFCSL